MVYGPIGLHRPLPHQDWGVVYRMLDRYERAARAHDKWARTAKDCVEHFEGKQWRQEDLQKLMSEGRPPLTLNKIRPLVNLVVGYHLQNRTDIRYMEGWDATGTAQVADALNKIGKQIAERSQAAFIDAEVFLDGLLGGRGYYDTRLDFAENDFGEVKITASDPFATYLDPDGDQYDLNQSGFIFTSRWISLEEARAWYGPEAADLITPWFRGSGWSGMPSYLFDGAEEVTPWRKFGGEEDRVEWEGVMSRFWDWIDEHRKVVRLVDMQHYVTSPRLFFVDLETGDREPIPETWGQDKINAVIQYAQSINNPVVVQRRLHRRVRWTHLLADTIVYDDWSPYDSFTQTGFFPYFRRGQTQGLVEHLLDAQREINVRRSSRLNIVMRHASAGWIFEKHSLDAVEREKLEKFGSSPGIHIKYDSRGGQLKAPEQIVPPASPVAMEKLEQDAETDLKEISGINDSALGQIDRVQSGRAIEARQKQSIVGLEGFIANYKRSKELTGYKMLNLVQKHYTEQRIMRIRGEDGKPQTFIINQYDPTTQIIANDITLGKYAVIIDESPLSASFLEAQFAELLMLREKGVPIPDDILIEASSVGRKPEIVQRVQLMRAQLGIPGDLPTNLPSPVQPGQAPTPGPMIGGGAPEGGQPPVQAPVAAMAHGGRVQPRNPAFRVVAGGR